MKYDPVTAANQRPILKGLTIIWEINPDAAKIQLNTLFYDLKYHGNSIKSFCIN